MFEHESLLVATDWFETWFLPGNSLGLRFHAVVDRNLSRLQRHNMPASHVEKLPRDPASLIRSKEKDRIGCVFWLSHPT